MGHKLDDDLLVSLALQIRIQDEADFESGLKDQPYWCAVERSNGDFKAFESGYKPEFHEILIAEQIIQALNKEIAHDGAWVVLWTDNGTRFAMLWVDGDGDVQFTCDVDEDGAGMVEKADLYVWIGQAEEAWQSWHHNMVTVLDPTEDQLFKRAQGQRPPSTIH